MRTGLIFSGGGTTIRHMAELAREAEIAGLDAVYLCEAWRSGIVGLAAIALATERVEIGPYILNAYGRSPWLTAMSAVDLDELSGGRLVLGIGTGNKHINEEWQGIKQSRPLAKMREYVAQLKAAVSTPLGGRIDVDGDVHHMHWAPAVAPARSTIPVFLAALFPKMTEVAGTVADGIALGALLSPGYLKDVVLPRFRGAAERAGRDPDALGTTLAPFVSVGTDADAARDAARAAICHLYAPLPHPYYDFVLREQGFSKAADAAARHVPEGRIEKAMEAFTDDIIDAVTVTGTIADGRRKIESFNGLVDLTLFVNVNYGGTSQEALQEAFTNLIELGRKAPA
ncbi:MAG: LLM class flavin-dependent oxidoreductase [Gammaproteobacteria bacterium]|nr:LLM class flavin-dependent oxidoreductase [Gammaproteobacteria bacterium]